MKRKTVGRRRPTPFCHTMRRGVAWRTAHCSGGQITTEAKPGSFATLRLPSGLEVMAAALGMDRKPELSLKVRPARQLSNLIRAAGPRLSMFAAPGAVATLGELTRGRHVSIVRRRLNQFLAEPPAR